MPQIKPRGATLLMVVSVILIIMGAVSVISGLVSFGSGSLMGRLFALDDYAERYFRVVGIISMVTGAAYLVFGIFGVRLRMRADKAGFLLILGLIQVVIAAFSVLYNNVVAPMAERVTQQVIEASIQMAGPAMAGVNPSMYSISTSPALIIIGFIFPVLYVIGALLNKLPPKKVSMQAQSDPAYQTYQQGYQQNNQQGYSQDTSQTDSQAYSQGYSQSDNQNYNQPEDNQEKL